jgi:hypothetical protein
VRGNHLSYLFAYRTILLYLFTDNTLLILLPSALRRLYHERLAEVEKEATAISTGKHPNYSLAMLEINRRRKKQMEQVSEWRRHKNIDIHRQVQSSLRSAHATFLVRQKQSCGLDGGE